MQALQSIVNLGASKGASSSTSTPYYLMLEDGTSIFLLEDGSYLLLEA